MPIPPTADLTQATGARATADERAGAVVAFLLAEALHFDIRVGAAPGEMIMAIPLCLPREVRHWFEHELSIRWREIVDHILKNAGRRS